MRKSRFGSAFLLLLLLSGLPLYGAASTYLKIDSTKRFEILEESSYCVHDIRQYQEFPATSTPGLLAVDASEIFTEDTVFFGFGLPNVYMGKVLPEHKFGKFDAKSLNRAPSTITETDGRTQSGVFLVPTNLSQDAAAKIEAAARESVGNTSITCARANASVLHNAGFRVGGGASLDSYVYPSSLLRDLLRKGIEFEGAPVSFDIVISSKHTLGEFYNEIKRAESLIATYNRHHVRDHDTQEAAQQRREEAAAIKEVNAHSLVPADLRADRGNIFNVKSGRTTGKANLLRKLWGPHPIYVIDISRFKESVDSLLPDVLKSFPQAHPSWGTWIKKTFLFNNFMVGLIRYNMACTYTNYPNMSELDFVKMLQPHSEASPNLYNFVITGNEVIISKISGGIKKVSWALTKHKLLANSSNDVRYAGEFWKDSDGTIYFNNNSGTYLPSSAQLAKAQALLEVVLSKTTVQGVIHEER